MGGSHRWVFTMIVTLFAYLGFLRSCWSGWAPPYRVGFLIMGVFFVFVSQVLVLWVLWSMLSGPRHLLSALALGMCVGPCVGSAGPSPVFLLYLCLCRGVSLFPLFCPLVLVLLFLWVYLGPLGLLAWGGIAGGLGVTQGGFTAVHVVEDLLCCLVFFGLQLAAGS